MPCNELTDRADGLTEAVTCIRQWKISDLLVDLASMIDLLQVTLRSKGPSVKVCDHAWPHGSRSHFSDVPHRCDRISWQ